MDRLKRFLDKGGDEVDKVSIIFTAISIIATIGNAYKKRWCFVIWLFTNSFWCIYDFSIGAYSQAVLFAVYFVISIIGFIEWRMKK